MVAQSGHSGEFLLAEQRDVLQREGQIARVVDHDARRLRSGPHIAIADGHRVRVGVLERRRVVAALHRELAGPHIAIADGHRVRVGVLERRRVVAALHRELEREAPAARTPPRSRGQQTGNGELHRLGALLLALMVVVD